MRAQLLNKIKIPTRGATYRKQQLRQLSSCITDEARESMAYDVLIVGGGPAGLSAAIKVKQLAGDSLSVCLIEKGAEVGAHILSGNVFDPRGLKELLGEDVTEQEEFQDLFETQVTEDHFRVLMTKSSYEVPQWLLPPQLHNAGKNYIISLSQLCRRLATHAEALGVEIYPGFAASEVMYSENDGGGKAVKGIATRDVGIDKSGKLKDTFERGMELHARITLFAEGARGSCSEELISKFSLRKNSQNVQTYGLGIKEVWEVPESSSTPGYVEHSVGWPLQSSLFRRETFGGSFLYHQKPNLIHAGFVVGLDYQNPYLNPYKEFQRWKTHPDIQRHFNHEDGAQCIAYGARVLNEGGYHSIPKLTFPGGALIGCSAGFLNVVKIKGSHTAIKSGIVAAENVCKSLIDISSGSKAVAETGELDYSEKPKEITGYENDMKNSWVYDELREVRNCHASFHWGYGAGMLYNGLSSFLLKGREPWTLKSIQIDADQTEPANSSSQSKPIDYPTPDGKLTFDLLTNLQRSGTYHEDDQPAHLRIKEDLSDIPENVSLQKYAGPEQRFCPAGVYEYVETDDDEVNNGGEKNAKLVINAQNCIHCKCCSIKMHKEYINWTCPEGGGGPQYQVM